MAHEDTRTVIGLDGKPTRYMDFDMPIKAVELLDSLVATHKRFCFLEDVYRAANLFALDDPMQVKRLLSAFRDLGMILHFPEVPGCERLIILDPQWLVDSMACLIREDEHHGSLIKELEDDELLERDGPSHHPNSWTSTDIKNGIFSVELLNHIWGHKKRYKKLGATKDALEVLKKILISLNFVYPIKRGFMDFFAVAAVLPEATKSTSTTGIPPRLEWIAQKLTAADPQVWDFKLDFSEQEFLPPDLFHSLLYAVTREVASTLNELQVDLFKRETTIAFGNHHVFAEVHELSHYIRVHSINYGKPGDATRSTARFWLELFRKCARKLSALRGLQFKVMLQSHPGEIKYLADDDKQWESTKHRRIWMDVELDVRACVCVCMCVCVWPLHLEMCGRACTFLHVC